MASTEGKSVSAAGNLDFASKELENAIKAAKQGQKVVLKSSKGNDCHALGMLLYLILGDQQGSFLRSLSDESLGFRGREALVASDQFPGKETVLKLVRQQTSAVEAAEEFNKLLKRG